MQLPDLFQFYLAIIGLFGLLMYDTSKYIKEKCSYTTVQPDLFIIPQEVIIFLEKEDCPVNHSIFQWNVANFMSVRQSLVMASKQL